MSVLLDTHIWIWWVNGQSELSSKARQALDNLAALGTPPTLSDMSLWEAQMLFYKKKLLLDLPFERWLYSAIHPEVISLVRISPEVIIELNQLPENFHGDPADRIIVATARTLKVPLLTKDKAILKSRLVKSFEKN